MNPIVFRKSLFTLCPAVLVALSIAIVAPDSGARQHRALRKNFPLSKITPEDLLAATVRESEVQNFLPKAQQWWPSIPEFNVGIGDKRQGLRFYVAQSYQQVGEEASGRIECVLNLFKAASGASEQFAGIASQQPGDKGGTTIAGPEIGDDRRYFTRATPNEPRETTLRFRVGAVLGRISFFSVDAGNAPELLSHFATPVVQRVRELLDGKFSATPMPPSLEVLMPPRSVGGAIGPALGSAVLPVECWAVASSGKNAEQDRDKLRFLGAKTLAYRRYVLSRRAGVVIEATAFTFSGEKQALEWLKDFTDQISKEKWKRLAAGKTGANSEYAVVPSPDGSPSNYELQFAKGRHVCDVSGMSPFGKLPADVQISVRRFAELWYQSLKTE